MGLVLEPTSGNESDRNGRGRSEVKQNSVLGIIELVWYDEFKEILNFIWDFRDALKEKKYSQFSSRIHSKMKDIFLNKFAKNIKKGYSFKYGRTTMPILPISVPSVEQDTRFEIDNFEFKFT